MKRTLSVLIAALVFAVSFIPSYATNVSIDGKAVTFTETSGAPFVDQAGRTQVPLRQSMEAFGCTVSWDAENKVAIVAREGTTVQVPVGKLHIINNGNQVDTDTAALIKDGKVYLPIRPVLEAFGATVKWDGSTQTVKVSTVAEPEVVQTITPAPAQSSSVTQSEAAYVGNSNTMKFHRLDCRYVNQIKDEHVVYLKTRDNAISGGYVPCKVCNP